MAQGPGKLCAQSKVARHGQNRGPDPQQAQSQGNRGNRIGHVHSHKAARTDATPGQRFGEGKGCEEQPGKADQRSIALDHCRGLIVAPASRLECCRECIAHVLLHCPSAP